MTQPASDREDLWTSLADGELTPAQFGELQQLLKADAAARKRYIDLMLLDTLLAEDLAPESIRDLVDTVSPPATISAKSHTSRHAILRTVPRTTRRWFAAAAAIALAAGVAVWTVVAPAPEASAATLITQTLRVHQLPLDRCYVIDVERQRDVSWWGSRTRVDRLWTRGDRFFLESSTDARRFKWGQDMDGRVWLTHGQRTGLTYEPNEVPAWLAIVCDALSMRLEPMLDEVLQHCDLSWEENPADPHTKVVRAVNARGAQPRWLKEARLEIDSETKVLKKLTVVRHVRFRTVTVSYTLAATEAQPDDRYELKGHLKAPFTIYSKTNEPQKRMEILSENFGNVIARSLLAPVETKEDGKE